MSEKVFVLDPVPTSRAGLSSILEQGGFEVVRPRRPTGAPDLKQVDAVLVTVHSAPETQSIAELRAQSRELVIVAVLFTYGVPTYRDALRAGASAAIAWDFSTAEIFHVVRAALAGQTLLPTLIARSLARHSVDMTNAEALKPEEVHWVRALARGMSVAAIARVEGYSSREMFRRLADVYRRMGVRNRYEAIAQAGQWGLLVEGADGPT